MKDKLSGPSKVMNSKAPRLIKVTFRVIPFMCRRLSLTGMAFFVFTQAAFAESPQVALESTLKTLKTSGDIRKIFDLISWEEVFKEAPVEQLAAYKIASPDGMRKFMEMTATSPGEVAREVIRQTASPKQLEEIAPKLDELVRGVERKADEVKLRYKALNYQVIGSKTDDDRAVVDLDLSYKTVAKFEEMKFSVPMVKSGDTWLVGSLQFIQGIGK